MMGYESFMVEIGLYFNTMVYDYKGIFDIGNEWHLVQKRLGTGSLLQNKGWHSSPTTALARFEEVISH